MLSRIAIGASGSTFVALDVTHFVLTVALFGFAVDTTTSHGWVGEMRWFWRRCWPKKQRLAGRSLAAVYDKLAGCTPKDASGIDKWRVNGGIGAVKRPHAYSV
jgi:hypothetical protein